MPRHHNVLVLALTGIGNLLLFTPVIRALLHIFPASKITVVVTGRGSAEVLEGLKNVEVRVYTGKLSRKAKLLIELQKKKFDLAITAFPPSGSLSALMSLLSLAKSRVSHKSSFWWDSLYTKTIATKNGLHDVEQNILLAEAVGIKVSSEDKRLLFPLRTSDVEHSKKLLASLGIKKKDVLIGLHIGSYRDMRYKCWPPEKFAYLCDRLKKEYGKKIKLLLFAGPEEKDVVECLLSIATAKPILISDETLKRMGAIISRCDLFISNDSGPMHIASAVGTPVVAIFGPTDPGRTAPWSGKNVIVRAGLDCSPCYQVNMPFACKNKIKFACLKAIPPGRVLKIVRQYINSETKYKC